MHPVETLWARHHPPEGYPSGVVAVPGVIRSGVAFFPGGSGLWGTKAEHSLPPLPVGGVMVLGHDFHSEAGYWKCLHAGGELFTSPTWSKLLEVLEASTIAPERCFFTNLYMGLRRGTATTGLFPGASDRVFVKHCQAFLLEQLRVQRPALVLTLGIHVPPVMGGLSPELAPWTTGKGLEHLDKVGPVRTKVTFRDLADYQATAVALVHPSLQHANLKHRRYRGLFGSAAQMAMLRDGMIAAGMSAD